MLRTHRISRTTLAILGLSLLAAVPGCGDGAITGPGGGGGCFIFCGIGPIGPFPDPPHTWVPAPVSGDRAYVDIAMTDNGTCAVTATGETWCWGAIPQLGGAWLAPTQLASGVKLRTIVAGGDHYCGLGLSGGTYCWGANGWKLLGTDDSLSMSLTFPSRVSGGDSLVQLRTTGVEWDHSSRCGLTASGRALCWGWNDAGQLGRDTSSAITRGPTEVVGGNAFVTIDVAPRATCALDAAGAAWCWGDTALGRTGILTYPSELHTPARVSGGHTFTAIAVGASHACGIENGSVWCWGDEFSGALGDLTYRSDSVPRLIAGLPAAQALFVLHGSNCILDASGAAFCWGSSNYLGAAGIPEGADTNHPFSISTPARFSKLVRRLENSCGLALDGRAWCWGRSDSGRLGNGT